MNNHHLIIAVDGHSSCGKSTLAKDLAKHFQYKYIDTGAMYRAVTLFALNEGIIQDEKIDELELKNAFDKKKIRIEFNYNKQNESSETILNDVHVDDKIRGLEVSNYVSPIAQIPFVRHELVRLQREMGKEGGIVMDGRDIGTNVFPNADLKIFLTADAEIRAERRFKELIEKNKNLTFEDVLRNVKERDYIDSNRKTNPLRKADDAILIDNSSMSISEQTNIAINLVNKILNNIKQ
jgi:cytidylate kinase